MFRKYFAAYIPKEAKKKQRNILILGSILGIIMAIIVFSLIVYFANNA